jgi:hypothetical protein
MHYLRTESNAVCHFDLNFLYLLGLQPLEKLLDCIVYTKDRWHIFIHRSEQKDMSFPRRRESI